MGRVEAGDASLLGALLARLERPHNALEPSDAADEKMVGNLTAKSADDVELIHRLLVAPGAEEGNDMQHNQEWL